MTAIDGNPWRLWRRWVMANAGSELVGLGGTFALTAYFFTQVADGGGAAAIGLTFLFAVLSGVVEATVVGLAQWWALHPWFPAVGWRAWWLATLAGALIAYVLGYLPSTLMDLGADAGAAPASEPPQWVVLLLAAGLGAVGGAVLSFAQWLVLRRVGSGSSWWIPANMLAWAAGMPLIFWGIDMAQRGQPLWQSLLLMATTLLAAGAVVGAIHGLALVRMVERARNAPVV